MDYTSLGKRIRTPRKLRGLTQEKLAEMAGISFAFVGHIERGTRIPSFETVVKLADALDCSIDEFVGRQYKIPELNFLDEKGRRLLLRFIDLVREMYGKIV